VTQEVSWQARQTLISNAMLLGNALSGEAIKVESSLECSTESDSQKRMNESLERLVRLTTTKLLWKPLYEFRK
jgi:hypothetical protein